MDSSLAWDWSKFVGGQEALRYNSRELRSIDEALQFVPRRRAVVQAGGNLGIFPKYMAAIFTAVYTFEPDPDLFALMMKNAPEANIIKMQAALGCDRKMVGMSKMRRDGKPNLHEGVTHVSGKGIIPTLAVDDLSLPVCDLIYLDVEGYELFALLGSVKTIVNCRPVVACEINKHITYVGHSEQDIFDFMETHNYKQVLRVRSDVVFVPTERR